MGCCCVANGAIAFNQNISNKSVMIEIVYEIGFDGEAIISKAERPMG